MNHASSFRATNDGVFIACLIVVSWCAVLMRTDNWGAPTSHFSGSDPTVHEIHWSVVDCKFKCVEGRCSLSPPAFYY